MCGIAGIKRYNETPIPDHRIKSLLLGIEHRGHDATGIALKSGASIAVYKAPETAWKVVGSKAFGAFLDKYLPTADTALLHTRAATLGSPEQKENNHPLIGDCVVVHNGVIHNHERVFSDMKWERKAEVDSDIIRAIIDYNGFEKSVVDDLDRLAGSAAFAALHPKWPDHMLFGRSGNPLVFSTDRNFLMWASEKNALHGALRPWQKVRGIWFRGSAVDAAFTTMPTDTVWLVGPTELEWHEPFKTSYSAPVQVYSSKKGGKKCGYVW